MGRENVNMTTVEKTLSYMQNNPALAYNEPKNAYSANRYDVRARLKKPANAPLGSDVRVSQTYIPQGVEYSGYFDGIGNTTRKKSLKLDMVVTNKNTYGEQDIADNDFSDATIQLETAEMVRQTGDPFIMKVCSMRLYGESDASTKSSLTATEASNDATFYKKLRDDVVQMLLKTNVTDPKELEVKITAKYASKYDQGRQVTNLNANVRVGSDDLPGTIAGVPMKIISEDNFKTDYAYAVDALVHESKRIFKATATALQIAYAIVPNKSLLWDIANLSVSITDGVKTGMGANIDTGMELRMGAGVQEPLNKLVLIKTEYVPVTGVTITTDAFTVAPNATKQLAYTIAPATASVKDVTFTTGTAAVATVSATGLVKGLTEGTSVITIKTVDGEFTDTVTATIDDGVA